MLKRLSLALSAGIGLLLIAAIVASFLTPITTEICSENYETAEKYCAAYNVALVVLWQVGKFFDDHAGGITALFTVVLSVSTIFLWKVTAKSANVAERALTELERAFLFFTEVTDAGFQPNIDGISIDIRAGGLKYRLANHGKTPAVLTEILAKDVLLDWGPVLTLPDPIDPLREEGQRLPGGIGIGYGESREMPYDLPIVVRPLDYMGIVTRAKHLFFMGYVRYVDIFKKRHRTGFCLIYDISAEHFIAIGDERYNYTKDED